MLRNKRILLILILALVLFLIPSICNASDTFITSDGIVAKKVVDGYGGTIELRFSNINLNEENNYTWGIGRNTEFSDVQKRYPLGDFSQSNKSAVITLTASGEVGEVLKETNTAWIYIKDNTNNSVVVEALKVDLTLPLLRAFNIVEDPDTTTFRSFKIGSVYGIDNLYYNIQKITDENVISNYKKAKTEGKDLSTITNLATVNDAPETGWKVMDENYYAINNFYIHKKPTDSGIYYVWIKGKDEDSKMVYGYNIFGLDNEAPTVSNIKVIYPNNGTYKTGQTVKIRVNFNETITGTTVPTLKIKFGDSAERALTNGTIKDNYIEYSYNIQQSDVGQLATVELTGGTIKDAYNNNVKLSCPIISGNTIKANVDGTVNNQTENLDTNNSISSNKNKNIPTASKQYKGHYYYIFEKEMTWEEAKKHCESLGGHLVTITTKEEQAFIETYLSDEKYSDRRFWLGATDKAAEGTWKWVTGEKFSYSKWGEGEPDNNYGGQDYLIIENRKVTGSTYDIEQYEWDDIASSKEYFICEWDSDKQTTQTSGNTNTSATDNTTVKDTTIKNDSKLPQTGIAVLSLALSSLIVVAVISKVKYGKYKDI